MSKYWVSWYSGNYADEGCTAPPFKFFVSGYADRNNDDDRDDCTICALFDTESLTAMWSLIATHFPDYRERFAEAMASTWLPGDRFPNATVYQITTEPERPDTT